MTNAIEIYVPLEFGVTLRTKMRIFIFHGIVRTNTEMRIIGAAL